MQRWDYDILKSFRQEGRLGDIITLRGKVRKKIFTFSRKIQLYKTHQKMGRFRISQTYIQNFLHIPLNFDEIIS